MEGFVFHSVAVDQIDEYSSSARSPTIERRPELLSGVPYSLPLSRGRWLVLARFDSTLVLCLALWFERAAALCACGDRDL